MTIGFLTLTSPPGGCKARPSDGGGWKGRTREPLRRKQMQRKRGNRKVRERRLMKI